MYCFSLLGLFSISQQAQMEHHRHPTPPEQEFPQLLVLHPPAVFTAFHHLFTSKFQVLKAYESPLPTDLFLTTYAESVRAVLCAGSSPITANVLSHLPSLQVVVSASAGVNHIDFPECRRRGISVANAGTVFSEDVADVAVVLLIDVLRKITGGDRFVRRRDWPCHGNYPLGSKIISSWEIDVQILKAPWRGRICFRDTVSNTGLDQKNNSKKLNQEVRQKRHRQICESGAKKFKAAVDDSHHQ